MAFNFAAEARALALPAATGPWRTLLDSASPRWRGEETRAPDPGDGEKDIISTGAIQVSLAPQSLLLLAHHEPAC
jgi:hypothetical protein